MNKRIFKEDTTTIALLYNYIANGDMLLSAEKVDEFDEIVDNNLEEMDSKANLVYPIDYSKLIYFTSWDEVGNQFYILKPGFNEEKAMIDYLYNRPFDITKATQCENALDSLGLKLQEGKFIPKANKVRKKTLNIN